MQGRQARWAAAMAVLLTVPAFAVAAMQVPASAPASTSASAASAPASRPAKAKPAASSRRPLPANAAEARERVRESTRGMASWYGGAFQGKRTASGEPFDVNEYTAAHPTLPFGTVVEVRSLANGRTVRVRINDRGPHTGNRIIDLSEAAARSLGLHARGTKRVELTVLGNAAAPESTPAPAADADAAGPAGPASSSAGAPAGSPGRAPKDSSSTRR